MRCFHKWALWGGGVDVSACQDGLGHFFHVCQFCPYRTNTFQKGASLNIIFASIFVSEYWWLIIKKPISNPYDSGNKNVWVSMLKIFSFQLPKETDHIRQRAETLELACWHSTLWKLTAESTPTVTVFCLKLPLPKTLDRAQEGVMGEEGRGRWLSAIELCTLTVQLWTKKS